MTIFVMFCYTMFFYEFLVFISLIVFFIKPYREKSL